MSTFDPAPTEVQPSRRRWWMPWRRTAATSRQKGTIDDRFQVRAQNRSRSDCSTTKLQWNSKKNAARQPEPDEALRLSAAYVPEERSKTKEFSVNLTGSILIRDKGLLL